MVVPVRTAEQRSGALKKANEVRVLRANMKRELTFAKCAVLVKQTPPWMKTMRLEQLLDALPGWGRSKVARFMVRCGIASTKTVGGLSPRQRRLVLAELAVRAAA